MNNIIKKIASTLSLTTLLFSIFLTVHAGVSTETDAANSLSSLWIIVDQSGTPEAYNLGATITRREILKVMINMSLVQVWNTCTGKFIDLPESDWGCKYAEVALSRGFIAPNSFFRPDDSVSKAEALKMIFQSRGLSKDYSYEDWRVWYIAAAIQNRVLDKLYTDYNTAWTRGWIFLSDLMLLI